MHHRPDQTAIDAEAAAWLARLQGHGLDDGIEQALQAWLSQDPRHRDAFGRACEIWDLLPGAADHAIWHEAQAYAPAVPMNVPAPASAPASAGAGNVFTRPALVMAAALIILLLLTPIAAMRDPRYETATGETRVVRLDDGSRITLNTNSLVAVDYAPKERRVRLLRGEALFEVSKDSRRPFIVAHEGGLVRALGTAFVVRDDPQQVSVTLIEGRVEVTRDAPDARKGAVRIAILSPGERITVTPKAGAVVDHPSLNIITAWRKGEVMFDDTRLIDAASEYNRYIRGTEIVVDPSVASLSLSGVFTTRDPMQFAETVAALHNIQVRQLGNEIHISR
ncbi:FecR family protein [Sphingomonas sp. KC8]|uniref:FecR family protein n=1 Tax=Sphingomonas sp. KC8 TaxID=1030157 RepID=UPI0002488E7A|nr:FecR domain-containing protein [Sphingomonas sp. KC8]ARS26249.1 hypothetical protein KC8_02950 [Sphingomonas sp. KC8]